MKIYTKTGDLGQSSLLGGSRVSKADPRLEAYGTVDELNAWLGLVLDQACTAPHRPLLTSVQEELFVMGSHLAAEDLDKVAQWKLPALNGDLVLALEKEMDRLDAGLEPLRHFVLPGGHPASAMTQVARTVCRRAERCVVLLAESQTGKESERLVPVVVFLNRLSDYLFVLSREILRSEGAQARLWIPQKGT